MTFQRYISIFIRKDKSKDKSTANVATSGFLFKIILLVVKLP